MHFRNQILRAEFGTLKKPVIAFWVNSNFCETVKFEAKRFKTKFAKLNRINFRIGKKLATLLLTKKLFFEKLICTSNILSLIIIKWKQFAILFWFWTLPSTFRKVPMITDTTNLSMITDTTSQCPLINRSMITQSN